MAPVAPLSDPQLVSTLSWPEAGNPAVDGTESDCDPVKVETLTVLDVDDWTGSTEYPLQLEDDATQVSGACPVRPIQSLIVGGLDSKIVLHGEDDEQLSFPRTVSCPGPNVES